MSQQRTSGRNPKKEKAQKPGARSRSAAQATGRTSLVPRLHLARHTYFDSDTIAVICRATNARNVRLRAAKLQLVSPRGRIAYESDVSGALGPTAKGEAVVNIPTGILSPGDYTAVLLLTESGGEVGSTSEVLVVRDRSKERLSGRNYIHSPLPLTNYLGDIDRMLLAYEKAGYNYLMRTSWARETAAAQITDDYKLLPYNRLHADFLGKHGMQAEIEFTSVGVAPESRNPRLQKAGAMEYAVSEEGKAERETTAGASQTSDEEFTKRQEAYRRAVTFQGRKGGICPMDDTVLERRELVYSDILENYFAKPGVGNVNIAHKPQSSRFPACFCDVCQKEYVKFLQQFGYKPEQFGKRRWSEVKMPPPESFQVDESKIPEFFARHGVTQADADRSGEVLWVGLGKPLGDLTGYAQDYRELVEAGLKMTPREWVAINVFSGHLVVEELRRLKSRVQRRRPDFRWSVEMAHPSAEIASNLAMMGGNAWSLGAIVDYLSISAGLCGPWLWYDGYFNCYCSEVLSAALDHRGTVGITLHQDELGALGCELDSGHFYDLAPEQFKEWVATPIAHGTEGVGMDNCTTPHQIWMYDGSCPSGRGELGPAFALLGAVNEAVGPSLARSPAQRSEISILYGYSRLLRYAASDTHQGFKFLHRGFGGGSVNFVHEAQVMKGALKDCRALFVFGDAQCIDEDLVKVLRDWVRRGGLLVADVHTGRWDRDFAERKWLRDLFGCEEAGEARSNVLTVAGAAPAEAGSKVTLVPMEEWETFSPSDRSVGKVQPIRVNLNPDEDTEVLARWDDGSPAMVGHRYGQGKAVLAGFFLGQDAYFASDKDQDVLSRLMAGLCYAEGIRPFGFSDNLNYETGVRDGGKDVKYAVLHLHVPQNKWRPREEMVLHSWMETDPTWENLPQLHYRPVRDPFPADVTMRGKWVGVDALTGEEVAVRAARGDSHISESLRLGEMRTVALMSRKPARLRLEPVRKRVQKSSKAAFRVSFLDRQGQRIEGCLPFKVSVRDRNGERPELSHFTSTERSGLAVVEFAVGADAEPGTWAITAECPMLGLREKAEFNVVGEEPAVLQVGSRGKAAEVSADRASAKLAGGRLILENGLVKAVIKPDSMEVLTLQDKRTGRVFSNLGEHPTSHLVDADGTCRVSLKSLSHPNHSEVGIESAGPVLASATVLNSYEGALLREWTIELDAGSPNLRIHSNWVGVEPLGLPDGEWLCVGSVKASGRLTTVESFMESWQNERVENYRVFQGAAGKDATVEYLVSQTPTLPPSTDWGKPTPMEAGFNIYPQLAWYDVSTADAGITVIAGLEDALDSRSIHIQEFGAIGFKKVLYEKGKGCLTWPGGCYPTIAKSVPRETICYSQLSFDYLFAPHAGGCPDLAGRIPDAIAAGQLPPHDLHLSTEPDGEPKRLLIAPSDVVSQVGCRVQTIAVVEGLGVPRRGVVVYAPWEGPTDELKASWKGIDLPIQCEDGCIICSIPALEANECGQLVLSAPA